MTPHSYAGSLSRHQAFTFVHIHQGKAAIWVRPPVKPSDHNGERIRISSTRGTQIRRWHILQSADMALPPLQTAIRFITSLPSLYFLRHTITYKSRSVRQYPCSRG